MVKSGLYAAPAGSMMAIRPMREADLAAAMHLKTEAGWNQIEADWRRFIALEPDGCFVAELNGEPVATTTTCVFDSVAWIAMVLVDDPLGHFQALGYLNQIQFWRQDYLAGNPGHRFWWSTARARLISIASALIHPRNTKQCRHISIFVTRWTIWVCLPLIKTPLDELP